jgi:hypothetical protein
MVDMGIPIFGDGTFDKAFAVGSDFGGFSENNPISHHRLNFLTSKGTNFYSRAK